MVVEYLKFPGLKYLVLELQCPACGCVVVIFTGFDVLPNVGWATLCRQVCALCFNDLESWADACRRTEVQIGKLVVFKTHAAPQIPFSMEEKIFGLREIIILYT